MLKVIISPAKKMKIRNDILPYKNIPFFIKEAEKLFSYMGNMSFDELKDLWKCSDKLVEENERQFRIGNLKQNLSPAILSYEGIQYKYMAPAVFEEQTFTWLEKHLRILSGFYGALCPFDGVIPYRLEMQARFHKEEIDNLYDFWGQKLADYVLKDCDCLINLASKEYSKSILKYIPENVRVITCVFGELIDGKIKEKGTYAKMARGSLVRYMAEHQIENPEEIKQFDELGYKYKILLFNSLSELQTKALPPIRHICDFSRGGLNVRSCAHIQTAATKVTNIGYRISSRASVP